MATARALLADGIEEAFDKAMHQAWREWRERHPSFLTLPSSTLRALGVHEMAVERVSAELENHPRVLIVPQVPGRRRAHFLIKDRDDVVRMIVQTKKLDRALRTSNLRTREAVRFDAQRPLPGLPMGPRLTLGYRIEEHGTKIVTEAVYRIDRKPEWHYELSGGAAVEQLPLVATSTRRIRAKPGVLPSQAKDHSTEER
jgi:hypothetical protein